MLHPVQNPDSRIPGEKSRRTAMENNSNDERTVQWVDVAGSDGAVLKQVVRWAPKENDKTPKIPSEIVIRYWTVKNDKREHEGELTFLLGDTEKQVFPGWEKVLLTMKKGEISKVKISKPQLLTSNIPQLESIAKHEVFEIELKNFFRIKNLDKKGLLKKKIIERVSSAGPNGETRWSKPIWRAKCLINMRISDGSTVFVEKKEEAFTTGSSEIPRALDKALRSMRRKEKAIIYVSPDYHPEPKNKFQFPVDVPLQYEIQLLDVAQPKQSFDLDTFKEKEDYANELKTEGNNFFNQDNHRVAIKYYKQAIEVFELGDNINEDGLVVGDKSDPLIVNPLMGSLYVNVSISYGKLGKWRRALEFADKAVKVNSKNSKALYRKALAELELNDLPSANMTYNKLLSVDKANPSIKILHKRLQQYRQESKLQEQKMFGNVFQKIQQNDQKALLLKRKNRWRIGYQLSRLNIALSAFFTALSYFFQRRLSLLYLLLPGFYSFGFLSLAVGFGVMTFGTISKLVEDRVTAILGAGGGATTASEGVLGILLGFFGGLGEWLAGWIVVQIQWLVYLMLWAGLLLMVLFSYRAIVLSLISGWMVDLSCHVEQYLNTNVLPEQTNIPLIPSFTQFKRYYLFPIKLLFKELLLLALIYSLSFLFPFLAFLTPLLTFLSSSYFTGITILENVFIKRKISYEDLQEYYKNNWGLAVGIGIGFLLLGSVPVVGWILAPPCATVAATISVVNVNKKTK